MLRQVTQARHKSWEICSQFPKRWASLWRSAMLRDTTIPLHEWRSIIGVPSVQTAKRSFPNERVKLTSKFPNDERDKLAHKIAPKCCSGCGQRCSHHGDIKDNRNVLTLGMVAPLHRITNSSSLNVNTSLSRVYHWWLQCCNCFPLCYFGFKYPTLNYWNKRSPPCSRSSRMSISLTCVPTLSHVAKPCTPRSISLTRVPTLSHVAKPCTPRSILSVPFTKDWSALGMSRVFRSSPGTYVTH